jgi:hypothetical protein
VTGISGSSESNNTNFNQIPRESNQFGNEKMEKIQEGKSKMLSNRQKHEVQQPQQRKKHQNRLPLEPKHPAGARMRASGRLTAPPTESFLTSSSNVKPFQSETTKIASRPSENLLNNNGTKNNRNYVHPKPYSGVVVVMNPSLLSSIPQETIRNQFHQALANPVDPKDMNPANTSSHGIKENSGAKMKSCSTTITGNTTPGQRKPPAKPTYIDLIDDDNEKATSGTRKMKRNGNSFIHAGNPSRIKRKRPSGEPLNPVLPDWSSDIHQNCLEYMKSELAIQNLQIQDLNEKFQRLAEKRNSENV